MNSYSLSETYDFQLFFDFFDTIVEYDERTGGKMVQTIFNKGSAFAGTASQGAALKSEGSLSGRSVKVENHGSRASFAVLSAAGTILKTISRFFIQSATKTSTSSGEKTQSSCSKRKTIKVGMALACTAGLVVVGLKMSALLIPLTLFASGLYFSLYMI